MRQMVRWGCGNKARLLLSDDERRLTLSKLTCGGRAAAVNQQQDGRGPAQPGLLYRESPPSNTSGGARSHPHRTAARPGVAHTNNTTTRRAAVQTLSL